MLGDSISRRRLPVNLDATELWLFEHELEYRAPQPRVLTLRGVRVNFEGWMFRGSRILPESYVGGAERAAYPRAGARLSFVFHNYLRRKRIDVEGPCVWCVNDWSDGYFHWMTEALSRLLLVLDRIPPCRLLMPGRYQNIDFITSSLRALGIADVTFVPDRDVFYLDELVLPDETAISGNYNEELIRGIRERLRAHFGGSDASSPLGERIYVSRRHADRRRILNEDEVISLVREHGFRTVHFEELSFMEQATLCSRAQYLIGNHGAGLTNMLFMESGGRVLEFRKKADSKNNCYFSLASALGLDYFYQTCSSNTPEEDPNTADIIVDVSALERNLDLMLGRPMAV